MAAVIVLIAVLMGSAHVASALPQGFSQFVCPEALPSQAERDEQDIRLTTFIKLNTSGYVGDGDVIRTKRQFYEEKGCKETLRQIEDAEKAGATAKPHS